MINWQVVYNILSCGQPKLLNHYHVVFRDAEKIVEALKPFEHEILDNRPECMKEHDHFYSPCDGKTGFGDSMGSDDGEYHDCAV